MADLALESGKDVAVLDLNFVGMTNPAGVALSSGDVVTLSAAAGAHVLSDANVAALDRPFGIVIKDAVIRMGSTAVLQGRISGFDLTALDFGDPVFLSSTPGKLASAQAGVSEVQTLTESGSPTGGTFTLGLDGQETAEIAYDATGAQVATALGLLSNIGAGNVSGSGGSEGPFVITFGASLQGKALPLITLATNSMTGGSSPTIGIVATTEGVTLKVVGHVLAKHDVSKGQTPDKILMIGI